MPDLELTVFNKKLKLSYQENEKERLINIVKILNENWKKFSHLHGKVSDTKIIIIIALKLQDSIEDLKLIKDDLNNKNEKIKKQNIENNYSLKNLEEFKLELQKKNEEILKIEKILDELNDEIFEIKNNMLNKNYE